MLNMEQCFVIQPFDSGQYDDRFAEIYEPSLEKAALKAYRVDKDPRTEIPIESIEQHIRDSAICLADISEDNPNVWYELGFAIANRCPVILICSDARRDHFPFDIQHRTITRYSTGSPSTYEKLGEEITKRAKALLESRETVKRIAGKGQVAPIEGLSPVEMSVLAVLAGRSATPTALSPVHFLKDDVVRSELLTDIGFAIALRRLQNRKFVEIVPPPPIDGYDDEPGERARLTPSAWEWLDRNSEKFLLKREESSDFDLDDEIPF